jgi:hypothetical protein
MEFESRIVSKNKFGVARLSVSEVKPPNTSCSFEDAVPSNLLDSFKREFVAVPGHLNTVEFTWHEVDSTPEVFSDLAISLNAKTIRYL